jgi:hypothetical protein
MGMPQILNSLVIAEEMPCLQLDFTTVCAAVTNCPHGVLRRPLQNMHGKSAAKTNMSVQNIDTSKCFLKPS